MQALRCVGVRCRPSASGPMAFSAHPNSSPLNLEPKAVNTLGKRMDIDVARALAGRWWAEAGAGGMARHDPRPSCEHKSTRQRGRDGEPRAPNTVHAPASHQGCCDNSACHCPHSLQTWAQRALQPWASICCARAPAIAQSATGSTSQRIPTNHHT